MTIREAITDYLMNGPADIEEITIAVQTNRDPGTPSASVRGRLNEMTADGLLRRRAPLGEPGQKYERIDVQYKAAY